MDLDTYIDQNVPISEQVCPPDECDLIETDRGTITIIIKDSDDAD